MKDIPLHIRLKYYKRPDVQQAIVQAAAHKEIAVVYGSQGYGKRPDILKYPNDILTLVQQGATSFHCSEELWANPLQLQTGMSRAELDELRTGWDLVLDIDCTWLEYSKIAAHLLVEALKYHDITTLSIKFSGNHGFHIAVPFKAFPQTIKNTDMKNLFPEGPRIIAAYLKKMIISHLCKQIMHIEGNNWENIKQKTRLNDKELKTATGDLNVDAILQIDTVLISSRHLYRMPYSFNEKSGLISIPIIPEEVLTFDKTRAQPEKVVVNHAFLDDQKTLANEARKLIIAAVDAIHEKKEDEKIVLKQEHHFEGPTTAVPQQYFPPCIQHILNGLVDGKKRSLFVLTNFLSSCGWDATAMEQLLTEWNKKNPEQVKEVYLKGQLRYHQQQNKKLLPPNCANKPYYQDLHICTPDNFCPRIKNPANYALLKQKIVAEETEKNREKKTKKENTKHVSKDIV